MKSKTMLLALGLLALAFSALPAIASAGTPEVDSKLLNEGKTLSFTSSGGASELRANSEPAVKCTANSGTGKYTNKTTGEVELTFTGCTSLFGLECHTVGLANGVITTGTSVFHNVYLTDAKTTPGVLVTPPTGGVFAKFKCAGFGPEVEVKGNGVLGDVGSPKCGETKTTGTLSFTATGSVQTYKNPTATTVNGTYNLTSTTAGGSAVEAAEEATGTVTYPESVTVTCV
jgi:hypothetical protein